MRCQEIRMQLASYRELSRAEQNRFREHLTGCPSCAATLAAYNAQDQLLSALPVIDASPALAVAVRARTVGQRRPARWFSWRPVAAALSLLLFFSVVWGTAGITADAVPGDVLFPIKRGAEQLRLVLTLDVAARDRYRDRLAERRREEVREVIRLMREARVEFQGDLVAVGEEVWVVDGFAVRVTAEAWVGAPPPTGSLLVIDAQAASGQLKAGRVRVLPPPVPTPTPHVSPQDAVTPSPTPASTGTPTSTPGTPAGQATAGLRHPKSTPSTSAEPRPTPQAGLGQPSITPGTGAPGPQPSVTPDMDDPSAQPSITPDTGGPGPQPSLTPDSGGPGPQPSVTPGTGGPGPHSSVTPGTGGQGPPPSMTPGT